LLNSISMRFSAVLLFLAFLVLTAVSSVSSSGWTDTGLSDTILFALGVGNNTVFAAGESSNAVKQLVYSNDHGKSWQNGQLQNNGLFLLNMVIASNTSGIVGGVSLGKGAFSYTATGKSWVPSNEAGVLMETSQSGQLVLGTGIFGLTGQWNSVNGVSFSADGGKTFTRYNIPLFNTNVQATAGSFPSASTWFVVGGFAPNNNSSNHATNEKLHFIHRNLAIREKRVGSESFRKVEFVPAKKATNPPSGFFTNVVKTTDGGKTWNSVFTSTNFAAGDIRFVSTTTGFFVASNADGSMVYLTTDGGNTWKMALNAEGYIMSYASTPTATDFYIGGASGNGGGMIFSSHDGGNTWSSVSVPGVQMFATMAMSSATQGYAAGLAYDGLCHIYSYGF
jgi:photosystem II stability/assembly factor-like uncharacterized protein